MEALVYTFLLIGTLLILFFSVFFRETPKIIKKLLLLSFYLLREVELSSNETF
jgi:photosystem II PsbT protein